uniref:Uncharacterized protein n=1 Tax=Tetraselmis sp. GSL018 TaxID=582737 RepID=A0A061R7K2_9CHLO
MNAKGLEQVYPVLARKYWKLNPGTGAFSLDGNEQCSRWPPFQPVHLSLFHTQAPTNTRL